MRQLLFCILVIFLPTALFGQTKFVDNKQKFSHDSTFVFLAGFSFGYSPMRDLGFSQWLNNNQHGVSNIYYMAFKATWAVSKKNKPFVGIDIDFYGTWNTTNYPLRLNFGLMLAKRFKFKWANIILTGTGGYNSTWVNSFDNPVPSQFKNLSNPTSVELNQSNLYISPTLKLLLNVSKKHPRCTGLDIGGRLYLLPSMWSYKYSSLSSNGGNSNTSNSNTGNQPISGIPNPTRFDFYINFFIGGLGH